VVNLCILFISLALTAFVSLLVVQLIKTPHTAISMSKSFVRLVVVPTIYGYTEQTVTAARSWAKNIDWIIEIAIDSSIRVTLFVLLLAVLISWFAGDDLMSLFFDAFQVIILGLVVLLVNYIMYTSSSYWYRKMMFLTFS
jgi:Ca2+:H+ antiporter